MSDGERRKKERRRKQSLDSPQTIEANKKRKYFKNYLDSIRSVTSCVPFSLKTAFLISSDNAMEISGCGSSRKKSLSALDRTATSFSLAVVFRN